ncbi:hypothetical protein ZOSMA_15G00080 [Zostera marina]|uniref:Uncharacterized protein n=1 Tax=Zostera marina TaxID=29655 RepID=A0A0K9PWS0_ZOSMR|nr:hypothetical protein ZOSMA_15G00080 [Zostera marina]
MEKSEFGTILEHFPIVRSRNFCLNERNNVVRENIEDDFYEDPFWEKLRIKAEKKVSPMKAANFCKAFQQIYKKLVYEELSLDAARNLLNSNSKNPKL